MALIDITRKSDNEKPRHETVDVFFGVNDGLEGVVAIFTAMGPTPMMFASISDGLMKKAYEQMQQIANEGGKEIRHARFSVRKDMATFKPK